MTADDERTTVDLGQALRGHRCADLEGPVGTGGAHSHPDTDRADAWPVLAADGLVWTDAGRVSKEAAAFDT